MIPAMKISDHGVGKLAQWENDILHVYKDSAGHETIGIGHLLTKSELMSGYVKINGVNVKWVNGLTEQQSFDLCDQDLDPAEYIVNKLVNVPLTQNQFDALVIFAFNIGSAGFEESSALKSINLKAFDAVPDCMRRWNKITDRKTGAKVFCQGLANRREKEIALFLEKEA